MKNNKIKGGATIWARQTIESDIFFWRPDKWFKMWFFIVNKVNHKDTKLFKRGTNFMTYEEISSYTKATKNEVDGFIRYAKKSKMLTTQKTTRGMIVEVVKYDIFQNLDNYKTDTKTETKPKQNRNTYDTINKNDKNDKNDKNSIAEDKLPPQIFSLEDKLLDMEKTENSFLDIIASFIREKPVLVENSKQLSAVISRYCRVAKKLSGAYTNKQIFDAVKKIKNDNLYRIKKGEQAVDFTLDTVYKQLTK